MVKVIINGGPQAGKDTFIELFCEYTLFTVYNISTVDRVKKIAGSLGWNGVKTPKARKFLSDLKDAWTEFCDGPFKDIEERIRFFLDDSIVFIHSREPEEIQRFKEELEAFTLLIVRDTGIEPSNHADREVQEMQYDFVIENNKSLKHLGLLAQGFIIQLNRAIDEIDKEREE